MSKIILVEGSDEIWDERKQEFLPPTKPVELELEHSLVSLSLWESKWEKPYLGYQEKTEEEILDYVRCMTLNDVDPEVYSRLSAENLREIQDYILAPMTATTIQSQDKRGGREIITSEILYCQMIMLHIPVEFEHWHLNRLLTLIKVCAIKNDPNPKKMPRAEAARQRAALNAKRRAAMHSRG